MINTEALIKLGAGAFEIQNRVANGNTFQGSNFGIYSSSGKIGQASNMTSLIGIKPALLEYIIGFEKTLNFNRQNPIKLIISGGTERGHAGGKYSHAAGWKIDFAKDPELKSWFRENNWQKTYRYHYGRQEVGYLDPDAPFVWWEERTHWDVGYQRR